MSPTSPHRRKPAGARRFLFERAGAGRLIAMPHTSNDFLAQRVEVMVATARSFAHDEFRATSMADISREAGLSVGGVYRHSRGRYELIGTVVETNLSAADELFAGLPNDGPRPVPSKPGPWSSHAPPALPGPLHRARTRPKSSRPSPSRQRPRGMATPSSCSVSSYPGRAQTAASTEPAPLLLPVETARASSTAHPENRHGQKRNPGVSEDLKRNPRSGSAPVGGR